MRAVPSLEPSSTTSTSMGWSLATSERTVFSMHLASLYAGTRTVTGSVIGPSGPQRKSLRRTRRACHPESSSISPKRAKTRKPMTARQTTIAPVMPSEAWTRKTHARPFHSSVPLTGVCALGAPSASVRFSNR